eukprot:GFUD01010609.1.p1 GENE.GFUD01010609.1~~GFUD01010609.1.p1  ORF type:complete len:665 (+),score=138.94 GFUD01010609.1:239-2233(+)
MGKVFSFFRRLFGNPEDEDKRRSISKLEMESLISTDGNGWFIKLKGLPWKATEKEIAEFLVGCSIVGSVFIINNEAGKPSGDAVAKLMGKNDLERALMCNKKSLHERTVGVEETDSDTYIKHVKKVDKVKNEENTFLHLKGLVWTATEDDIKKFLNDCNVKEVVLTTNDRGKPSGDAFVHLDNEGDVQKAMAHNREYLRERFVIVEEIYKAQYIRETQGGFEPNIAKDNITKSYSDCLVRLGNLPLTSSESDIQSFLIDVLVKKITISRNESGKPSGEAVIETESNEDLVRCLICNNSSFEGRIISVDKVETSELAVKQKEKTISTHKQEVENKDPGSNRYIKLKGLPWKVTEDEIEELLIDCEIVGNVFIIFNEAGKPSGDAVVKLMKKVDLDRALKCNNESLHGRFVCIQETDSDTYNKHARKVEKIENEENTFIRLKGLVWSATAKDIRTFLKGCNVKEVVLTTTSNGKPSGNAYVHLESEADVQKALAHNRKYLRERFVLVEEIYESQYFRETKGFVVDRSVQVQQSVNQQAESESEGNSIESLKVENGTTENENIDKDLETVKKEEHRSSTSLETKKPDFKFEIIPFGYIPDYEDLLEDCKDLEIDGIIWHRGQVIEDSDSKANIILGCTVENTHVDAEIVKQKLEAVTLVSKVNVLLS